MISSILTKVFGSSNDRHVKKIQKNEVIKINSYEEAFKALSDEEIREYTNKFRERFQNNESLDQLLYEAFAIVREAASRTLGLRHYDVQMVGGIVLHKGQIAEMRTGEGKTLMSTLPIYLNALAGSVHVITVNDYLAERDANWMKPVFEFLGLSVGVVKHDTEDEERQQAYACDITYGTNNEFGFDYLRDNMKFKTEEMVQDAHKYAIIDEVDSILIDEARTPLIISGQVDGGSELYGAVDRLVNAFDKETHCEIEEKHKSLSLTEEGMEFAEQILIANNLMKENETMYSVENIVLVHHLNQALKAHYLFEKDKDYMVKNDEVMIIDEFTGRAMEGRRYSDGLHQALEAKENVTINKENQTLASITYQNYFRMYEKLSGMTGTAMTEEGEFDEIYKLKVVTIPTHKPIQRKDDNDFVYRTLKEKNNAIVEEIQKAVERGQPVLVGTASIERSEEISELLIKSKVKHSVLNAKYHQKEALIVAQSGMSKSVTIATNMAGRGTDIKLGGNLDMLLEERILNLKKKPTAEQIEKMSADLEKETKEDKEKVIQAGGLYVIGTERHESRRIDNQLRGRSGRQGDPGQSRFFLSLEDDLMRIFGSNKLDGVLRKLGLKEGEAIEHPWVSKALEKAQQKVEAHHFEIRKHLLKYDDVINEQRKTIFSQRSEIMAMDSIKDTIAGIRADVIDMVVGMCIPENSYADQWDVKLLSEETLRIFGLSLPFNEWAKEEGVANVEITEKLTDAVNKRQEETFGAYDDELMADIEKGVFLQVLDGTWKEHLVALDYLRQGIGLRAYAQKDPLNEFKREAFNLFTDMLENLKEKVVEFLFHIRIQTQEEADELYNSHNAHMEDNTTAQREAQQHALNQKAAKKLLIKDKTTDRILDPEDETSWGRVPRNSPCPCLSGKKYKHCHGKA